MGRSTLAGPGRERSRNGWGAGWGWGPRENGAGEHWLLVPLSPNPTLGFGGDIVRKHCMLTTPSVATRFTGCLRDQIHAVLGSRSQEGQWACSLVNRL